MRLIVFVLCAQLLLPMGVLAHGGRTNRCGGHSDRIHGGYHAHDEERAAACETIRLSRAWSNIEIGSATGGR
jgi:hypothetical protein